MEEGDVYIVLPDKTSYKLFNINSKVAITVQEPLKSNKQIGEDVWGRMRERVGGNTNNPNVIPKISDMLKPDCFLSHKEVSCENSDEQAGDIHLKHLLQFLKPNLQQTINSHSQPSTEDPLTSGVLGVEREAEDGHAELPDVAGSDIGESTSQEFSEPTGGRLGISTLGAKRIINDTYY